MLKYMDHKFTRVTLAAITSAALIAVATATASAVATPTPEATAINADQATFRASPVELALQNRITGTPAINTATNSTARANQGPADAPKKTTTKKTTAKKSGKKKSKKATAKNDERTQQVAECKDPLARTILDAGFTGNNARLAWSIVMRESHGRPLAEDSPYFSGALGAWQIQTSAWSKQKWWSRSAMLDIPTQTRIVYKHLTENGSRFIPWGVSHVTSDGTIKYDFSQYSGWNSTQRTQWIVNPVERNWRNYPC